MLEQGSDISSPAPKPVLSCSINIVYDFLLFSFSQNKQMVIIAMVFIAKINKRKWFLAPYWILGPVYLDLWLRSNIMNFSFSPCLQNEVLQFNSTLLSFYSVPAHELSTKSIPEMCHEGLHQIQHSPTGREFTLHSLNITDLKDMISEFLKKSYVLFICFLSENWERAMIM